MVLRRVYTSSLPLSCHHTRFPRLSDREADDARRQSLVELEQQQDAQLVQAQIVSAFMQAHAQAQAHSHSASATLSSSQSASAAASSAAYGTQTFVGGSDGGDDDDFQRALQMSLLRDNDQSEASSASLPSSSSSAPSSSTSADMAIQSAEAATALESGILASVMRDSQRALLDSLPKAVQFVHLNMKYCIMQFLRLRFEIIMCRCYLWLYLLFEI